MVFAEIEDPWLRNHNFQDQSRVSVNLQRVAVSEYKMMAVNLGFWLIPEDWLRRGRAK